MKNQTRILVSVALLSLIAAMALARPAKAAHNTVVMVVPDTIEIANVGENATIDVWINETDLLFAFEIKVWFLNSIVTIDNASVVRPAGHFLEPVDPANQIVGKWKANPDYNATNGMVHTGFSLLAPESPRNGSGVLFRMTFTGVAIGNTPIILSDQPEGGIDGPVKLSTQDATPIPHTAIDGSITVIPEFPIALLLPILAVTTIAAASFTRVFRKRRI